MRRTARTVSAKGEGVSLGAGIEEFDFERMIGDYTTLAHELIEPLIGNHAHAFRVDIRAMVLARRGAINRNAETHGLLARTATNSSGSSV